MRYIINLLVETDNEQEIEEVNIEGDLPITDYLNEISQYGGDFLQLVVKKVTQ